MTRARAESTFPRFAGLPKSESAWETSPVAVLPVPYELTTCYMKGTAAGPAAIIGASAHAEFFDDETGVDLRRVGIHTCQALQPDSDPQAAVQAIGDRVRALLSAGKFVITLGGEHAVTIGAVEAHCARHPRMGVLVIDAHADLRNSFGGTPLSHACASRRASERCRVTLVGIRSMSLECMSYARTGKVDLYTMSTIRARTGWMESVVAGLPEEVYISIDADGLDPSIMPGVGTPEPGGLGWYEVTRLLRRVIDARRVVGFDLVEVMPIAGQAVSEFAAARLVMKFVSYMAASRGFGG